MIIGSLGLSCLFIGDASAFAPRRTGPAAPAARAGLELADGTPARTTRGAAWNRPPARAVRPHAALAAELGASDTLWDPATGVPRRIWGAGAAVPGALAAPGRAAAHAGQQLRRHLALLAPGSTAADLVQVSDHLGAGIRSVGFRQHWRGRPVLGGQVSFRYKADRLVAIASEALPHVRAELTDAPISSADARARAVAWVLADAGTATAGAVDGPFILPVLRGRVTTYREVLRVQVEAARPLGRHDIYLDAGTGEPVAREQTLRFAGAEVRFDVPTRGPQGERGPRPAPRVGVKIADMTVFTDALGKLTIPDVPGTLLGLGAVGELVAVSNKAAGGPAALELMADPGDILTWDAADDEIVDAQLTAYVHANLVKEHVRGIAPDFAYLDKKLAVRVNIAESCNAFSDGDAINFFHAADGCENTGRIADIVYHEFGHSVHQQGIIEGVGGFEGALSEGVSDYLCATITDDSGTGRGFVVDAPNEPLREINPPGNAPHWPEDLSGEPHNDGLIIAGTLWDLRELLREKLGPVDGPAHADKIWFEAIRRASDIPTMYPEALLVDDDDGDLANGTPNACEINKAFHEHGLLDSAAAGSSVKLGAATPQGIPVDLLVSGAPKECVDLSPTAAILRWRIAGAQDSQEIAMELAPDGLTALLPAQPDDTVIEYQIVATLSDQTQLLYPLNPADPWYQTYVGPVTELYCTGFEGPAGAEGWTFNGAWEQGAPLGESGDPSVPFAGAEIVGMNLAGVYKSKSSNNLTSPVIPTEDFKKVRLQYRRWLGVEDAHFDQATIRVSGLAAWQNFNSKMGDQSNVQHRDHEWRFHDLDITPGIMDGAVQLQFQLKADMGLELAGWNLDELCVVGVNPVAQAACGDGLLSDEESCDDGNQEDGDGCSAACQFEGDPTDGVPTTGGDDLTTGEPDGAGSSSSDSGGAELDDGGCGCRSTGPSQGLAMFGTFGLLALAGLRRRRL